MNLLISKRFNNKKQVFGLILTVLLNINLNAQLNTSHFRLVEEGYNAQDEFIEGFYIHVFEESVQDYKTYYNDRHIKKAPKKWGDPKLPIVNVTYDDAIDYCKWLSEKYDLPFRLPTEIEWEYAARAGNFYDDNYIYNKELPNRYVVYIGNSHKNDKPNCISCMQPNEIGLYAMCGNVWEWTVKSEKSNTINVVGGSFFEDSDHVKVNTKKAFNKYYKRGDLGFRVVVNAKDFKDYIFLEKAKTLLEAIKRDENVDIEFSKNGIYQGDLFIDWDNFETFSYNEENRTAEFCCWVQNKNNLGYEIQDPISFKFNKKTIANLEKLSEHLNNKHYEF